MARSIWSGTISFGLVSVPEPFKPEKYDDTYRKELLDLIRKKAKGQKLPEPEPEIVDLMVALRESVENTARARARTRPRAKKKAS